MNTHQQRYSEAFADDIAAVLTAAGNGAPVKVYYDRAAGTYGVRIRVGRDRFELLVPAPGAQFALFRNGAWLGGVHLGTDAAPAEVARAMLGRIASTI